MKLNIKGSGHPSSEGWSVTDSQGNDVDVKSIDLHVDTNDVRCSVALCFHDVGIEVDAELVCKNDVAHAVCVNGHRLAMCSFHASSMQLLADANILVASVSPLQRRVRNPKCMEPID